MSRTEWKDITVFISSTFNDMHAERDDLVRFVFPELREWCAARKLRLNDIDLRWGITLDDTRTSRTIGICLRDIDRSRPYFLCFLGQRKGWQPDDSDIDDDTRREYPELPERLRSRSVTEIEIEHALLAPLVRFAREERIEAQAARHAFVFLRDDTFTDRLSPAQKRIYTNWGEAEAGEDPAHSERVARADRDLEALRRRLEEKLPRARHYRGEFDPDIPMPELGGMATEEGRGRLVRFETDGVPLRDVILEDFKKAILEDYPDRAEAIPETTEDDIREMYIDRMASGYIERPEDLAAAASFISGGIKEQVLVLHSPSGAGKTTLMAELYRRAVQAGQIRALIRFCGVGNESSTVYGVFSGIFRELGIPCPPDLGELQACFTSLLARIPGDRPVLLMADALDQIPGGAEVLEWLPGILPDHVRILCSIRSELLSGPLAPEECRTRGYALCGMQPFSSPEDKQALVDSYLKSHLKRLDDGHLQKLFAKKGSSNPLYLLAAVSELRLVGRIELLEEHISRLGDQPEDLFDSVMQRMEEEYLADGISSREIVSLLCSLISVSRYGLSRTELEAIFVDAFRGTDRDTLCGQIQIYLRQLREFTLQYGINVDFRYNALRRAAAKRYRALLPEAHARIAACFLRSVGPKFEHAERRPVSEVVYHLLHSEPGVGFHLLTDIRFLKKRLALTGIGPLIEDFRAAAQCGDLPGALREQAESMAEAVRKSAYILTTNPEALAGLLAMRLSRFAGNDEFLRFSGIGHITAYDYFIDRLRRDAEGAWLRTVSVEEGNSDYTLLRQNQGNILDLFVCSEGLLTVGRDGSICVLDEEDGSLRRMIREGCGSAVGSCFRNGRLYISDDSGMVSLWDIPTGLMVRSAGLGTGGKKQPSGFPLIAADGDVLILGDGHGRIVSAEAETLKPLAARSSLQTRGGADCLFLAPGDELLAAGHNGLVQVYRKTDLTLLRTFRPGIGAISALWADAGSVCAAGWGGTIVRMTREGEVVAGRQHDDGHFVYRIRKIGERIFTFSGSRAWSYAGDLSGEEPSEGIIQSVRLLAFRNDRLYFVTSDQLFGYADASVLRKKNKLSRTNSAAGICNCRSYIMMWYRNGGAQFFVRHTGRAVPKRSIDPDFLDDQQIVKAVALEDSFLVGTKAGKMLEVNETGNPVMTWHSRQVEALSIAGAARELQVNMLDSDRKDTAVFLGYGELFLISGGKRTKLGDPMYMSGLMVDSACFYIIKNRVLTVFSLSDRKELRHIPVEGGIHKSTLNRIIDPGSAYAGLVYLGYSDKIVLIDTRTDAAPVEIFHGSCLDFDVRGDLLAVALDDRTVRIYRNGIYLCTQILDDTPTALCFNTYDNELYVGTHRGSLLRMRVEIPEAAAQDSDVPEPPREKSVSEPWSFTAGRPKQSPLALPLILLLPAALVFLCILGARLFRGTLTPIETLLEAVRPDPNRDFATNMARLPSDLWMSIRLVANYLSDKFPLVSIAVWIVMRWRDGAKNRKARGLNFLLPAFALWALAGLAYWLTARAGAGRSVILIMNQVLWTLLWLAQLPGLWFFSMRKLSKTHSLFGKQSCFRLHERWMNLTALGSFAVLALMLALSLLFPG